MAVDDQEHGRQGTLTVEKMALDGKGFPQPTGECRDTRSRLAGPGAWARTSTCRCCDGVPGLAIKDGTVQVAPQHDDRLRGHFRRWRHGAVGAHRDRGGRARQEGGAPHRRLALRAVAPCRPQKHELATFEKLESLVLQRRAEDGAADARPRAPHVDLRRGRQGGLDETNALFEARRCLSCGNCFECDNCYGVCPDNAVIKLGPGHALRVRLRLLQGLRHLRRRVSLRRDRDGPGDHLKPPRGPAAARTRTRGGNDRMPTERSRPSPAGQADPRVVPAGIALLRDPC